MRKKRSFSSRLVLGRHYQHCSWGGKGGCKGRANVCKGALFSPGTGREFRVCARSRYINCSFHRGVSCLSRTSSPDLCFQFLLLHIVACLAHRRTCIAHSPQYRCDGQLALLGAFSHTCTHAHACARTRACANTRSRSRAHARTRAHMCAHHLYAYLRS